MENQGVGTHFWLEQTYFDDEEIGHWKLSKKSVKHCGI